MESSTNRVIVHLDINHRQHSFNGQPSVIRPDGKKFYFWHGVQVPDFVITNPEKITVEVINKEQNTEVRRVMLEKFGFEKYLKASKASLRCKDKFGKLWEAPVPNDEALVMVEVLNSTPEPDGSIKTYFLRVPPHIRTPRAALAWTFQVTEDEYEPVFES